MKVLLIVNEYTTIINFRMELVKSMVDAGHTVAVALPDHERNEEIREAGCCIYSLPMERKSKNPFKDFRIVHRIYRILKNYAPDIVFTFTIKPNVYGGMACAMKRVPYVATITGLGSSIQNDGLMRRISLTMYRIGLKKAREVFFQNTDNRDFLLKRKVYTGPYDMIPGSGVNLSRFHLMDYPAENTLNFVFVARVMKEKGIEEFLEMCICIGQKYPQTRFHVCGPCEESYRTQLKELEERGAIIYHGMVKDMPRIYAFAHCIVHPSYHEGMANVLLESAACGRAVIASNIAGCREVVESRVNGFLATVGNSKSLIKQVEKFIALSLEERKRMGIAGRKKMEKEFDRQTVVKTYLKTIDEL